MSEKTKHLKVRFIVALIKKPAKFVGYAFLTLIGVYAPVYLAQVYEQNVYDVHRAGMTNAMAAHYTNMISFAYQVAALATVVIGYLMLKKLWQIFKSPNPLDAFYQKYPEYGKSEKKRHKFFSKKKK